MALTGKLASPRDDDDEANTTVISAPVNVRSLGLTILAVVAATFALKQGRDFFIPLVLAILISHALDPLVTWLSGRWLPRALAAGLIVLLGVSAAGGGAYVLREEAVAIVNQLPDAAQRIRQALARERRENGSDPLRRMQEAAIELERAAHDAATRSPAPKGVMRVQVEEPPIRLRDYLWWGSAGIMAFAGQVVAVLFLVYFLLASGDLFKRKLVQVTGPTLTRKKITVQILDEINLQIERFLVVQLLTSAVVAAASFVAFAWLGLDQAPVWALAAGVFNTIPYFGPVVVTSGITVVAFLQFGTFGMAALFGAVALAITSLEGYLLMPWLTSRAARMNAVAIFVGLLFWTWVWGVWGTLLAVPLLTTVKAVCDRVEDLQPVGELLGE
jgi:predicted PurR-regulated permease PerM